MRVGSKVRRSPSNVSHVAEPDEPLQHTPTVRVGAVDDPAERHADQLADAALALSRRYAETGPEQAPEQGQRVRRSESGGGIAGEFDIDAASLQRASAGGTALESGARDRLEAGFGRDLGNVRVHTGAPAADLASRIGARAFTAGSDIYFGRGEYEPQSAAGDRVLAHEVAHTTQHADAVHRYPATAMSAPVAWHAQTGDVIRPGAGASGGVYIMVSNDPASPVRKAVAKPVFGKTAMGEESAEQLVVSDRILGGLLGLKAPQSRIVKKGTPEFAELVATCQHKQPPAPVIDPNAMDQTQYWKPLAQAESFVVMSEVPNATSMQGMAENAANDRAGTADLIRTVFNPKFLRDLGKLMIGDMLVGNPDRLLFGADNIGNVMVSMQNGSGELHAIDTTAYLAKSSKPSDYEVFGNSSKSVKDMMTQGPEPRLDRFFAVIVNQMQVHAKPPANGAQGPPPKPMWQIIEEGYARVKPKALGFYQQGWDDGLAVAMTLAGQNGDEYMDMGMDKIEGKNVSKAGLKANAAYLAGRAGGGSHDDGLARSAAINLSEWARSFDRTVLSPPGDALNADRFVPPSKHILSADWVAPPSLLAPAQLQKTVTKEATFKVTGPGVTNLARYPQVIATAHAEVDQNLAPKKRGVLRKSVPRDRNQLGHAIVDAHAVIAGAGRVMHKANLLNTATREMKTGLRVAQFEGTEGAPVKQLGEFLDQLAKYLQSRAGDYANALAKVNTAIARSSYAADTEGAAVVPIGTLAATQIGKYDAVLDFTRKADLTAATANI